MATLLGAAHHNDAIIATAFLIVGGYGLMLVRKDSLLSWFSVTRDMEE